MIGERKSKQELTEVSFPFARDIYKVHGRVRRDCAKPQPRRSEKSLAILQTAKGETLSSGNTPTRSDKLNSDMGDFVLAASHLSSVFASSVHVPTHAVPTSRRDLPLATSLSDIPDDHASYSSIFHSQETGHVLTRVVQGGLAVELVSLSYNVSPIRFLFPAAIVPAPAIRVYGGEVYLIAVTAVGLLFRITLPYNRDGQLWHDSLPSHWCRDWQIPTLTSNVPKLVHVHDPHDVSVVLQSAVLRLTSSVTPLDTGQ